jgi:8-oxo-dGTP pyrophosphatase MutT (NUDIX family)
VEQGVLSLLDFDAKRQPPPPRDAATVVVLRDADRRPEVFCVQRHKASSFMGGALVFPGGKIDPQDALDHWETLATEPHERAALFATASVTARSLAVGACRELFEEGGILPLDERLDADAMEALGAELRRPGADLSAVLRQRRRRLALDTLVPWARWLTPEAESRRFDARFFLLHVPEGQIGRHDDHETTMSLWAAPLELLDRAARGEFFLAPPTSRTLEMLSDARDVHAVLMLAKQQSLLSICPRFVLGSDAGPPYLALPGDPSHEVQERRVHGPTRYVLRDGRFISEDPPEVGSILASTAELGILGEPPVHEANPRRAPEPTKGPGAEREDLG